MFCRVCLRKNTQVYYKLNSTYIDLMETITKVKMKINDLVCCFCLGTLRKIEKFAEMAKEVDSILKQSIITERDVNEVKKYYNLVVSTDANINIQCSTTANETDTCNIRDEMFRQIERELEEMEGEPRQLSEDTVIANETHSANNGPLITVTVIKEELNDSFEENGELHQLSKDTIVDNDKDLVDNLPWETVPDISNENEKPLNDTCDNEITEINGGYILKPLRICLRRVDADISLIEQAREERSVEHLTSNSNINYRIEEQNVDELNEKYNGDTKLAESDKPFACGICEYRSISRSDLSSHVRVHIEVVLPEELKMISSKEENNKIVIELPCEEVLTQNISQKRRNKTDIKDVLSNEIKEKTTNKVSKKNHVNTICSRDKPFSCKTCAYRTRYKSDLKKHLRTHANEKPFSCTICSYKCSLKSYLKIHLQTHTDDKPFSCNICSYKCSRSSSLTRHFRVHTGEKPFSCNICSYKCIQKSTLKEHLRTHTGEKPFSCNFCSYKCSMSNSLTRHLSTHTGEKPFSCNICSYKCSSIRTLRAHLKTHTGEKPFSCNTCSYKCSTISILKIHLRTHTGEKPFSCNVCSRKFSMKSHLNVHLLTHTGEKPFSCNICTYKFTQKSHLKDHLLTHTGEKPFSCNICSYKCRVKKSLVRHLGTHTDVKPFSCDICAYRTKSKSDLKYHLIRRHVM